MPPKIGNERPALHAYLSEEVHSALNEFSIENGVSMTGLIEALGLMLIDEIEEKGMDVRQDWVRLARKVDAMRRRR